MGNEFRLIADITLKEDTDILTVDKDMQLMNFELTEVYMKVCIKNTDSQGDGWNALPVYANGNMGSSLFGSSSITVLYGGQTKEKYACAHVKMLSAGYAVSDQWYSDYDINTNSKILAQNFIHGIGWDKVRSIVLNAGGGNNMYMGKDSRIQIWGR